MYLPQITWLPTKYQQSAQSPTNMAWSILYSSSSDFLNHNIQHGGWQRCKLVCWQFKRSMQQKLKVQQSTNLILKFNYYNLSHNPSMQSYLYFLVQLKYIQLYTITRYQSRQVLVTRQCLLETVLIETHGRPGGFVP